MSRRGCLRETFVAILTVALVLMSACGKGSSEGGGNDDEPEDSRPDFSVSNVVVDPDQLLPSDLLVVSATIRNTSDEDSGEFDVLAFVTNGLECNGSRLTVDRRTMSLDANSSAEFEVSRVPGDVLGNGTWYLCIEVDPTNLVDESDESNNLIGDTDYPIVVARCESDAQCDDGNPCTDDFCRRIADCVHIPNNEPCDDGLFCTVNEVCGGGTCQRGEPRLCDDPDLCDGTEYCDELAGECRNGPPVACDDGNPCNGAETCDPVDGACYAGTPISCDVLLNNGLAPPTSSNIIDHDLYNADSSQQVLLRDLGCPASGEPDSECTVSGTPTALRVRNGSDVSDLEVFDTSTLEVRGGGIDRLVSGPDSVVSVTGGFIESFESYGDTTVSGGAHGLIQLFGQSTVSGGSVETLELDSGLVSPGAELRGGMVTTLFSGTASAVRGGRVSLLCADGDPGVIYGTRFDQNAGMFGPLSGAKGFLSGTLELGDSLNAMFHQTGSWCQHPAAGTVDTEGFFTLLPPPSTFIANGSSGGDENTLDASDVATRYHDVFVRNANCPDAWPIARRDDPCSAPGAATEVAVTSGAVVSGALAVLDQSTVVIQGGSVSTLRTGAGARIEIWGEDFTVGGAPVPLGELTATSGVLMGTLSSGDPIDADFDREDPAAPSNFGSIVLLDTEGEGGV